MNIDLHTRLRQAVLTPDEITTIVADCADAYVLTVDGNLRFDELRNEMLARAQERQATLADVELMYAQLVGDYLNALEAVRDRNNVLDKLHTAISARLGGLAPLERVLSIADTASRRKR